MPRPPVTIETMGVRWRLDLGALPVAQAEAVEDLWSRARVPDDPAAPIFAVAASAAELAGAVGIVAPSDPTNLPYDLSRAVTLESIKRQRGRVVMLHAAGLASADGQRAVVLVARSGGGKSTAAHSLGARLGYLSDETVAVSDDLTLLPYPKPISLLEPEVPGSKAEYSPDQLGLAPTPSRATLAAVIELERTPDGVGPALVPDGLIAGLLNLVAQSSSLLQLSEPLQRLTRIAVAGGGPFVLRYKEIADCADLIEAALYAAEDPPPWTPHPPPADRYFAPADDDEPVGIDERQAEPAGWVSREELSSGDETLVGSAAVVAHGGDALSEAVHPGSGDAGLAWEALDLTRATLLWRGRWTDAVESEGEVLILRDRLPVHLAGIGATAWLEAAKPVLIGELAQRIVAAHGPNDDSEQLIKDSLTAMVEAGALVVVRNP